MPFRRQMAPLKARTENLANLELVKYLRLRTVEFEKRPLMRQPRATDSDPSCSETGCSAVELPWPVIAGLTVVKNKKYIYNNIDLVGYIIKYLIFKCFSSTFYVFYALEQIVLLLSSHGQ